MNSMEKINFKLKINKILIDTFEKTKNGYFFIVNGKKITMRQIAMDYTILVGCNLCNVEVVMKGLQGLISMNKPFLCRSCRNFGERNGMYGKKHTEEVINKLKMRTGEQNSFFGKHHSDETKKNQSLAKIGKYDGEKNPMYGKNSLDLMIKKYGLEIALEKWKNKSKNSSDLMKGVKNPMYGKSVYDVWVERFGVDEAEIKRQTWKDNISDKVKEFSKTQEYRSKMSESLKGRVFTDEHKKNLRLSTIEYINKKLILSGGKIVPHFNIFACKLFDDIALLTNTNIQHALNGGEYFIADLGYWVDGFDKENNIVYEYYEKEHQKKTQKDTQREFEIKEKLNCKFIIIHEGKEEEFLNQIL